MRIGIDSIEVERFAGATHERLRRIFTPREIDYFSKKNTSIEGLMLGQDLKHSCQETIAGIWCAKEAFFKALGTGIAPSTILELEVLHNQYGAPYYKISSKLYDAHRFLSTAKIHVSITHTKTTAIAVCVIDSSNRWQPI